jgi:hypothetical protein
LLAVRRRVAQATEERPRLQAHQQASARVQLQPARDSLHNSYFGLQLKPRAVAACGLQQAVAVHVERGRVECAG